MQAIDLKTQEELTTNSARVAVQKLREREKQSDKNGNTPPHVKEEDTKSTSSVTVTTTTAVSEAPKLLSPLVAHLEGSSLRQTFTSLRHTTAVAGVTTTRLTSGSATASASDTGGSQPVFPSPTLMGNEGDGAYSGAITRSKTNSCVAKPINLVPTSASPLAKPLPRVRSLLQPRVNILPAAFLERCS